MIPIINVTDGIAKKAFPVPSREVNKGTFGRAAIFAGSNTYGGAAMLSLGGAAATLGAGYVQLYSVERVANACFCAFPELLISSLSQREGALFPTEEELSCALQNKTAVAVGMGMTAGKETYATVCRILRTFAKTVVLDADALNALSCYGKEVLSEAKGKVILTPHPVEFSRLTGVSTAQILADPLPILHEFCRKYGVTVLLKGATTLVTDGKETYRSSSGAPGMAKAGSGDVLAGVLAGLFAREGALPTPLSSPLMAAIGAYVAGKAGEIAQSSSNPYSALPSDTVRAIASAVTQIYNAPADDH